MLYMIIPIQFIRNQHLIIEHCILKSISLTPLFDLAKIISFSSIEYFQQIKRIPYVFRYNSFQYQMIASSTFTEPINLIRNLSNTILVKIISFLDFDALAMIESITPSKYKYPETESFFKLIKVYYFIAKYLNWTDRSIYYTFYGDQDFQKFQQAHIANITEDNFSKFEQCIKNYKFLLTKIQQLHLDNQGLFQEVVNTLSDPCLPITKLRRENIGIFCRSSFQYFLTDIKYGIHTNKELQGPPRDLELQLQQNINNIIKSFFNEANHSKQARIKLHEIRFTPEILTTDNFEKYILENNKLHNLIACLFCTAQILASASITLIDSIQDPIHQLVEFNLRYSIFKNFVMEIEQKFSYAFKIYGEIYEEVFENKPKPKFNFWRATMAKWITKTNHLHQKLQTSFCYCLSKQRQKNLFKFLEQISQQKPFYYLPLFNKFQQSDFFINKKMELYSFNLDNAIEEFFERNYDLYELAGVEYLEYIIDVSVNEHTVHYCGHSQHALEQPYLQFQNQLLEYNKSFYEYIIQIVGKGDAKLQILKQIFTNQVNFLDICFVKPVTLNKIIKQANDLMMKSSQLVSIQNHIVFNFEERDNQLKYFNDKAMILESISNHPQKNFFSIWPQCTPNDKLMMCEASTGNTQNSSCLQEYFSDDQNKEDKLTKSIT